MKRLLKKLRFHLFYKLVLRKYSPLDTLGKPPFSWTLDSKLLNRNSIIYSAGVGRDISFEKALADKTGAQILLLDPTPPAATTMSMKENYHPNFVFLQMGLAGSNTSQLFSCIENIQGGSFSSLSSKQNDDSVLLPCVRLSTLMEQQGHSYLDLLKMDIEGSEYDVLLDIHESNIQIGQICVEFHHWLRAGSKRRQTISSIFRLLNKGYVLAHVNGWDHTFIKK